jgi:hypothetical protein
MTTSPTASQTGLSWNGLDVVAAVDFKDVHHSKTSNDRSLSNYYWAMRAKKPWLWAFSTY